MILYLAVAPMVIFFTAMVPVILWKIFTWSKTK
jgi:hypothetical protein